MIIYTVTGRQKKKPLVKRPEKKVRTCDKCGSKEEEKIKALGHREVEYEAVEPTCTEDGHANGTCCDNCGMVMAEPDIIPATGHSEVEDKAKDSTCTEDGLTKGSHCEVCGEVLKPQKRVLAIGHVYVGTVQTEASCVKEGTKRFECEGCGDSYSESFKVEEHAATEIYELAKNSVGEIITYDKSGSEFAIGTGFVYSEDGRIVTNYHVIEDAYSAEITIDGKTYDIKKVLAYDEVIDVAVLKIDAKDLRVLPLCGEDYPVGDVVYALGSSKGMTATFSNGTVTHARRDVDGVIHVQHNAAISGGNSGGPLINKYGEIIGINTFTMKDSQNLNFAICVSELDNLDYSDSVTLDELYSDKHSGIGDMDAYTVLGTYIIMEGTLSDDGSKYNLLLDTITSDGMTYMTVVSLDINSLNIEYYIVVSDDVGDYYGVVIYIDSIDYTYDWQYADSFGDEMSGTLNSDKFDGNTLLKYSDNNITDADARDLAQELATALVDYACANMDYDLSVAGITAYDLGFLNY